MADSFLFETVDRVLRMLGSQVSLAWGVESDLKRLERTLVNIKAVLLDAEEKKKTNREIRIWLEQLKDVFYDAEDVLDEFECEALRRQVVKRWSITRKVGRFFSPSNPIAFRFQMGHKIKEIRERLDEIAADKIKFHLTERFVDRRAVLSERNMTHSYVNPSNVIGRDHDRERIVELLMLPGGATNVSAIPIVGIGGLGKTTLAKFVYNDARVIQHFNLKMWVCVSIEFNIKKLIAEILGSAIQTGGESYMDLSMDQLQTQLRRTLDGEKFLLVLDDVWNDDRQKWIELEELLMGGADGSKIIVTTRNLSVASIMGTPTYVLKGLPHNDCLSVFKKSAFQEGQEEQYPNLLKIGNEIVEKCGGIPLAVRTLGCLLYEKTDEHSWIYIRDNKIWTLEETENGILPALQLSYDMMPSHLKSCFAYCSIFPKNFLYCSDSLVPFWMSYGLIQSTNENEELEDVGLQYFKELCSRSLFQDVTEWDLFMEAKMHHLVHDLARSILKREISTVTFQTQSTSVNTRHLLFSDTALPGQEVPAFMNKLSSVRTVKFAYKNMGPASRSFVDTCIRRFKNLRVLQLTYSTFQVLPSSIGNLKQLRYLDLYGSRRIKKLPNSICKLQNLQYLGLIDCEGLEEMPRNIGNMISLKSLLMTTKQKSLPEIGSLSSLRILFLDKCHNLEYLFEGKPRLTSLQTLIIKSCKNLISLPLHSLKYLTTLKNLVIIDCEKLNLMEEEGNHSFEGLRLRCLVISKLPQLVALPQWLEESAHTLHFLRIFKCSNFTVLPEWLKNFTSLLGLTIGYSPNLARLPDGTHGLAALRELRVLDCPALIERCRPETGEDWLKIAHVPEIYLDGKKITPMI